MSVTFAPDGNVYSLFNDQFATIVAGMAEAAGVAEKDIVINSVVYSSVVLNSAITTSAAPGSAADTNIKNALNNYFDNLNLPNLRVETTNVAPVTTTTDDDNSNTTLIIAIVVPIVVIRTFFSIQSSSAS